MCATRWRVTSKPRTLPPIAPSGSMTPPIHKIVWSLPSWNFAWNRALARVTDLQQRIDDHDRQRPALTSMSDDFTSLTSDLQTVWADPATDARLKKRIVRTLIDKVIADIEPQAGEIILVLH